MLAACVQGVDEPIFPLFRLGQCHFSYLSYNADRDFAAMLVYTMYHLKQTLRSFYYLRFFDVHEIPRIRIRSGSGGRAATGASFVRLRTLRSL
jgi:hypothetical protein